MITRIYSKVDPDQIILSFFGSKDLSSLREDVSPKKEFLQVAGMKLEKGFRIKAHKHKNLERRSLITQESWLVFSGKINAKFFDLDDTPIYECDLGAGDCVVVFRGGHLFEVLEENTIFYEFKNGPYFGAEKDRILIDVK
jgi:hypothetical protein